MDVTISPHIFLSGSQDEIRLPASKSHTIRRLIVALFCKDKTRIDFPLDSLDTRSCLSVCRSLGAVIEEQGNGASWIVEGLKNAKNIVPQTQVLDVGNSGTTLFLALAAASLADHPVTFTGDASIAKRSAQPLLDALEGLGVGVLSSKGCVPITVQGPWKGGRISLECQTSQYLSALLLAAPLSGKDCITEIDVPVLNEKPYIEMTLSYLKNQGVDIDIAHDFSYFKIKGGATYKAHNGTVAADFSSAAFPACAAVVSGAKIALKGLDKNDFQGDKAFFDILAKMGANVEWEKDKVIVSKNHDLHGGIFDLNDTPDLLPVCAVLACYAKSQTRLVNVAHARIKETDRIAVMARELTALGADIVELPDGLVINGKGNLHGGIADGHDDHRVVMALAVAALGAQEPVTISTAQSADVTYPGFIQLCLK
ncbi:MAG: 3-phosphoshikimate 1-carboxyvinyltransferase [Spirochaetaceae bacterium]|jgi:3-phosphoshikimate 1-carboxyvinyltransferase|nr:3-phosphoshikimate 1-carboxyvinyltransferase [Spirochaetaceae bacterium]